MPELDELLTRFEAIHSGAAGKPTDEKLYKAPEPTAKPPDYLDSLEERLTGVYEQSRRDRGEEQGYLETVGKGLVRGAEGIASGVGSIGTWAGEATGVEPLTKAGKWTREYFDKAAKEGWAAPDPVVFKGSFMDRPSLKRAAGIVSEALPSLAAALFTGGVAAGGLRAAGMAAGAAQKAGAAAGAFGLGALEGAPVYEEARAAGKSIGEASALGGAATIGTGLLEFLPISRMLKPMAKGGAGKFAMKAVELGGEEAAQEGTQQIFQNAIARYGYDATRDLTEGLVESIIGGFGAGAIAGTTSSRINRWIEDRRKQGIPDEQISNDMDQLGNAVSDVMERHADNVTQAPVTDEITRGADAILQQAETTEADPEDIIMGRQAPAEEIPPALQGFTPAPAMAPAPTAEVAPQSRLDELYDRLSTIQSVEDAAPAAEQPTAAQPIETQPPTAPAELQQGQPAPVEPTAQAPQAPIAIEAPAPATPEPQQQAQAEAPTPEAAPTEKAPVKRPVEVDHMQEKWIRGRIEKLGSLEAVKKVYSGNTPVEKYARALAEETFRGKPAAVEAPAGEAVAAAEPSTENPKPDKFTGKHGMAWVNEQQRPITGAREITRGKKKGQFHVTMTNGQIRRVPADAIISMPQTAEGQPSTGIAPLPKKKESQVTTLRGRIRAMGGINFSNFKGEVKDFPPAAKMSVVRKNGAKWDLAEQQLRDEGWLGKDESLVDVLRDPQNLRRNKVAGEGVEKREQDKTEAEKRFEREMNYEPEAPPGEPEDYITLDAESLPEGKKLTLLDNKSARGWDTYEVIEKDPFGVTLKDGETITLSPGQKIEVRKQDLGKESPESETKAVLEDYYGGSASASYEAKSEPKKENIRERSLRKLREHIAGMTEEQKAKKAAEAPDWIENAEKNPAQALYHLERNYPIKKKEAEKSTLTLQGEKQMPKDQAEIITRGKKQGQAEQGGLEFGTPETPAELELKGEKAGAKEAEAVKKIATKEPWEMTRDEFIADVRNGRDFQQIGVNPTPLSTLRGAKDFENLDRQAESHHEAAVTMAVAGGKSVSENVLEDYPELYGVSEKQLPLSKENSTTGLAGWVTYKIKKKESFTWQELFRAADQRFGGTQAEGKYSVKDAYDAMELGVNRAIYDLKIDPTAPGVDFAQQQVRYLQKLIDNLPTQTKRTQEQQEFQQFSTPPPLAYAANWVANLNENDVYTEPSAGNAGLAVFGFNAGVKEVYANELSPRRASILKNFPFKKVFTENAEQLNNILPPDVKPTVIVMNPPFSATGGRVQGNQTKYGAKHIEQALSRLQPGGRLVAIVGKGMGENKPAFREWWKQIKSKYNVRANIRVSGEEYKKYGTTFDNQLIVIDKTGPTQYDVLTGKAENIEDLIPLLEGVRNDRPAISTANQADQRPSDQSTRPESPETAQTPGGQPESLLRPAPNVGAGKEGTGSARGTESLDRADAGRGAEQGGRVSEPGRTAGTERAGVDSATTGRGVEGPGAGTGSVDDIIKGLLDLSAKEAERVAAEQTPAPRTKPVATPKSAKSPRGSTKAAKQQAQSKFDEGKAQVADAIKKFNDLFGESGEVVLDKDIDPNKWTAVREALGQMWDGIKKMAESVQEAAQIFIKEAYSKLSAKGKSYIDKFIREDIRAALEAEKLSKEQDSLPKELEYTEQGQNKVEDQEEIEDSLFADYVANIIMPGAKAHPSKLVQSVAMADTKLPPATYKIAIPEHIIRQGKISDAQIEAVVYSNQSFEIIMPNGRRRGFFIGDGTGVGKGREIGAIIWENWLRGRKKAIWISEKPGLMEDARRDLGVKDKYGRSGIGWQEGADKLFTFPKKKKKGDPAPRITQDEGILFGSYSAMAQNFKNIREDKEESLKDLAIKINQIVDWVGKDFDGVLAFDESHNMKNATSTAGERGAKKPAQKALAGIMLTHLLPKARVLYVSATGAVELENLVYADRLGLWGEGTPFAKSEDFIGSLASSGMAGMEMIARDLKARGLYISRSISFDDVEYDRLIHKLDDEQRNAYGAMARAWQVILKNINEVTKEHTGGKNSGVMSYFWGQQQRFFDSVVTSMQMPSVIESARRDIESGHSIVMQLTKTGNAQLNRATDGIKEGEELEDLDLSPKEIIMDFLQNAFPVQQFEEYTDENGTKRTRPVYDADNKPVLNAEAVRIRDELLQELGAIRGIPTSPLDMIIHAFGHNKVAEVTGRNQRLIYNDEGKLVKEPWSKTKSEADAAKFMAGEKRILVFSQAGGTGASYHADKDAANQEKRIHYLLQSGWEAVRAVQGLGRTHRSNQKQAPKYWLVTTDIKGQMRFISTIARRLDQLGALTKGQRQAGSQGIFQARDNLENGYAREALHKFFWDLGHGAVEGVDFAGFQERTGIQLTDKDGRWTGDEIQVKQFLNRILALEIDEQNKVFDAFSQRIDRVIQRHAEAGTLDVGIETISGLHTVKKSEKEVFTDKTTNAKTKYVEVEVERPAPNIDFESSKELFMGDTYGEADNRGYVRNIKSGRVWRFSNYRQNTDKDGRVHGYRTLQGPSASYQSVDEPVFEDAEKWERINERQAKTLWDAEFKNLPKTRKDDYHLLTGSLLPIWDRLIGDTRIYRMQTDSGDRLIGRLIPTMHLKETLENLGVGVELKAYTGEEVASAVLEKNATVQLVNNWKFKKSVVSGDDRIELTGIGWGDYENLRRKGAFAETIQYRTRFFIPTDGAAEIIDDIIKYKPVKSISGAYTGPTLLNVGAAPGTSVERRALGATKQNVERIQQLVPVVERAMRTAGLPQEVIDRVRVDLKPIIDLRGKDVDQTLADWAKEGKTMDAILGATTMRKWSALMELSLEQDLNSLEKTTYHEAFHIAAEWMLPAEDYKRVLSHYRTSEGAADSFADFVSRRSGGQPAPVGVVRRALIKLRNLLQQIGSWLRGQGFTSPEDIFGKLTRGEYAAHFGRGQRTTTALQAEKRAPVWYSQMEKFLTAKLPGTGTAKSFMAPIESWARKGEFKAEELEWSGLKDWLGEQSGKITKQQVLDYLAANNVRVQEVVKGEIDVGADVEPWWNDEGGANEEKPFSELTDQERQDAIERYRDEVGQYQEDIPVHAAYQLPGGQNYRELLLTLPEQTDQVALKEFNTFRDSLRKKYGSDAIVMKDASEKELARLDELGGKVNKRNSEFRSTHYQEPNILAHVRFNERTDADGKRVLFIEEVQSDWHQKGRKEGYSSAENVKQDKNGRWVVVDSKGDPVKDPTGGIMAYDRRGDAEEIAKLHGVPQAPFKTTWPMLAMKRMVRYAAENGFDSVAWTTGAQQIDRYEEALRKNVDKIEFSKNLEKNRFQDPHIIVTASKGGESVFDETFDLETGMSIHPIAANDGTKIRHLSDVVGKEHASRILESKENKGIFEGKDLSIGGEGMKGFYDKILPAEVNKLFNKTAWGNARVGGTKVNTGVDVRMGAYEGPTVSLDELQKELKSGRHSTSIESAMRNVIASMKEGMSWNQAIQAHGNISLAERMGGTMNWERTPKNESVHSLPITPQMREKSLTEGMTQFKLGRKPAAEASVLDEILPAHTQERAKQALKGVDTGRILEKIKEGAKVFAKTFTPGREHVSMDPRNFGKAYEILRNFKATKQYADRTALDKLTEILDPKNMSKRDYELFTLKVALEDLSRELGEGGKYENWQAMVEKYGSLQFGFQSADEVSEALEKANRLVAENDTVKNALKRRDEITTELLQQVVDAKLLPAEVLKDRRYFHHQVLEYLNDRYSTGTGAAAFKVGKKGYQHGRIENVKDYSLAYIESEFEVMAHQINQIEKKKNLDEMEKAYNIAKELKRQAKQANYVAVVGGQKNMDRINHLRGLIAEARGMGGLDSGEKAQLKEWADEIRELDPTMPYRQKIAMGYAKLSKALGLNVDEADVDDYAIDMAEVAEYANSTNEELAIPARTIFKAMGERNQFIKDTLGGRFVTELDLARDRKPIEGSQGWTEWTPNPRSAWYLTGSIQDAIAQQIMAGSRELQESDIRPVLARGKDETWIIPAELAQALESDQFNIKQHETIISKVSEQTLNMWKRWILLNPMRIIKYNLNNTSGDFDIAMAYSPKIFKHAKQAAADLWRWHYGKDMTPALKAEIDKALRDEVIGSGMTVHDIPDVRNQEGLRQLMDAMGVGDRKALRYVERFWQGSKNFTTWRENVLRLAAYRHFKDEIKAGRSVYGASIPAKVDAIEDRDRKAALLSRELVGDYGALSQGGQWLRRKAIPFYSWLEINAPRYYRMYSNLAVEGEAGSRAVRMGAVLAKKGTLLTAKVFALYAAAQLFNHLFWPDEEDELGEAGRRQAHLILGRREDGSIITLRLQGALSDALSWFNLHDFPEDIKEVAAGRKSVAKWAGEGAIEPMNKLVQGVRPDIKAAGELMTGRTLYPEFYRPRPIRDRAEYVAQLLSADSLYRRAAGRPLRGETVEQRVLSDLLSVFTYSADPGETAYYKSRDLVGDYLKDHNLERPMADPTSRVNALYYYKQAIKFGDSRAAEKYLNKYKELGGNMKGIQMSVKRAHPLGSLPNAHRAKFFNTLDPESRQTIKRGTEWYRETFKAGGI